MRVLRNPPPAQKKSRNSNCSPNMKLIVESIASLGVHDVSFFFCPTDVSVSTNFLGDTPNPHREGATLSWNPPHPALMRWVATCLGCCDAARFCVRAGGQLPPKPEPCLPNLCYTAAAKPANRYTGSVFLRVGVVDLVVFACVLRATTVNFLSCPLPQIFSSRTAPVVTSTQ